MTEDQKQAMRKGLVKYYRKKAKIKKQLDAARTKRWKEFRKAKRNGAKIAKMWEERIEGPIEYDRPEVPTGNTTLTLTLEQLRWLIRG